MLLGVSVGDAIGVPVEFRTRMSLQDDPVTGMRKYGSHHQPAGTWSDDSSLTFCLAEMLCGKYDPNDLARRFVNWEYHRSGNRWSGRLVLWLANYTRRMASGTCPAYRY